MTFGIVGPISKDHIILPTGDKMEKFGAVAYSASAMSKLVEGTADQVICLSHLSAPDIKAVSSLLQHPNINLSGLLPQVDGTTEIELTYLNEKERHSRQINVMSPFTSAEIDLLSECAAVLLMPLNETDIPLGWAKKLRNSSNAIIFLDVHGLVTGVKKSGERFRKSWSNAQEWLACIDILKMNEHEACWVAGHPIKDYEEFAQFAASIVELGPKACWITFGDQSSIISCRRGARIYWASVPVVTGIGPVVETTGCGDASSAGFVYSYTKLLHNPVISVILGNTLGSLKATFQEINTFPSGQEIRGVINQHYKEYLHTLLDDFLSRDQLIIHEIKGGQDIESFMYPDGNSFSIGANHARNSGSQSARK